MKNEYIKKTYDPWGYITGPIHSLVSHLTMTGHAHKKQCLTACLAAVLPPVAWGGMKLSDTWCSLAFAILWAQLTTQELVALAGLGVYYYTYIIANSLGMFDAVFCLRTYQTDVDNVTKLLQTVETLPSKAKNPKVDLATVTKHTLTLRHCNNRLHDRTSHKNAIISILCGCFTTCCMCMLWNFGGFTLVVLWIQLLLTMWQSYPVVSYHFNDYHERTTTPPRDPPVKLHPLVQSLCDWLDPIIAASHCISIVYCIGLLTVVLFMTFNEERPTEAFITCMHSNGTFDFLWRWKYEPNQYALYHRALTAASRRGDNDFSPVASDMLQTMFRLESTLTAHDSEKDICHAYFEFSLRNQGTCIPTNRIRQYNMCKKLIGCIDTSVQLQHAKQATSKIVDFITELTSFMR